MRDSREGTEVPGTASAARKALAQALAFIRARWRILATLAIAAGATLAFVGARVSASEVARSFARLDTPFLALAFSLVLAQVGLQAARLRVLLPPGSGLRLVTFGQVYFSGQMINALLPGRAGDVVKVLGLAEGSRQRLSVPKATGVLVADKLLDVLAIVVILFALASRLPFAVPTGRAAWILAGLVLVVLAVGWALARVQAERLRVFGRRFLEGLSVLARPRASGPGIVFSLASWICEIVAIGFLTRAVGAPLSFTACAIAVTALNLGILVPLSAANLGLFELSFAVGLAHVGVPPPAAAVVALVHHALEIMGVVAWFLVVLPFGWRRRPAPRFPVEERHKRQALDYFRRRAAHYSRTVSRSGLALLRERERAAVLALAALEPGKTLIDVGCGDGFYASRAKQMGLAVTAFDAVREMIESLRDKVDEVHVGDIEHAALDRTFDRVVCAGVLDFVLDPERAFRNLVRLVSPGGRLIVLAPRAGPGALLYWAEKWLSGLRVNFFAPSWFQEQAEAAGLDIAGSKRPLPFNMAMAFERASTRSVADLDPRAATRFALPQGKKAQGREGAR